MPLVPFADLMAAAERGRYAVGYFESWNLESLQAVADAAETMRSPVLLGFSGIYLHHPKRLAAEHLSYYGALGNEACRQLSVPAALVFNESPHLERVLEAIELQFGLVMFSDDALPFDKLGEVVGRVVRKAHASGSAVEAEVAALPGVQEELLAVPDERKLTDVYQAREFVKRTGVDALAVNVGQVHVHGREEIRLDLDRLAELRREIPVPLVLHGGTSIHRRDLSDAIGLGVRKVNVGSVLKRSYFEALRQSAASVHGGYNPYEVIGSGLKEDVLVPGRLALQKVVENLMRLFGSAGKA